MYAYTIEFIYQYTAAYILCVYAYVPNVCKNILITHFETEPS